MAPNQPAKEQSLFDELPQSPYSIIKLSANILNSPTVQKSLGQLAKFSQPLLGKIDNKFVTSVNKWISQEYVYNQLVIANTWLTHHIPESYSNSALHFIDKKLDVVLQLLNVQEEYEIKPDVEEKSAEMKEEGVVEKKENDKALMIQSIIRKLLILSTFPIKKVEKILQQIRLTQTYATLEKQFHIEEKIDATIKVTMQGFNFLKEEILFPSFTFIKVSANKAKSQVTLALQGMNVEVLKKKYTQLYHKYEVLQKCVVILSGETVNLVFDKKALAELGEKGKVEINRLYQEIKRLEAEKIMKIGQEYYIQMIKKAQSTYNIAEKAIEAQPRSE